jgi:uncharacterized cupin superfamily protein
MKKIVIVNENDLIGKKKNDHKDYQYTQYKVTNREDFDQCFVSIYEIEPGKSNYPMHYHKANTEAFYIISGEGLLHTIDGEIEIKAGDVIVCPPGEEGMHKISNTSKDAVLKYIDFDTTNSPDIVHYPNSNKIGVIVHNESCNWYKEGNSVDYYDGE